MTLRNPSSESIRLLRFETLAAVVLLSSLLLAGWHVQSVFRPWYTTQRTARYQERLRDLEALRQGLTAFHAKYGRYPVNAGFLGYLTAPVAPNPEWIPGLAPEFLPALPSDPARSDGPGKQYLYHSDGTEYKLIAHNSGDCALAKADARNMVDPARDCWAYGYWTPGAAAW